MLASVFASDIGAFYGGRSFGSRKLCPSVSPGKTVEGGLFGAASCIMACTVFRHTFFPSLPLSSYLLFISVAIAAPIGDLFESMLKRAGNIKDSGNILPGHGGLLDRIDSLLFTAPVFYIFSELIL